MICRNCNKMIPDGRNFCPFCGSKIIYSQDSNKSRRNTITDAKEQNTVANSYKPTTDKQESYARNLERPSDNTHNSVNNQEPKKDTSYVAVIAVLATLLCCAIFFIVFQSMKKTAPDNNTIVEETTINDNVESDNTENKDAEVGNNSIPDNVDIPIGAVVFQGHSYYIFDGNCKTWEEAHSYCKSRGGYLAVIDNELEDLFLFNYMIDSGRNEVYFGLSDSEAEGHWKWVDNKTSTYQNWGINDDGEIEPNKDAKDENYAEFDASLVSGRWNDCGFGRDTSAYICEWDYVVP